MSLEAIVLAVVSAIRPSTSDAVVVTLLDSEAPVRALAYFCLAALATTLATGLLVVVGFHGAHLAIGTSRFTAGFDLLCGVAALGFAAGRIQRPAPVRRSGRMSEQGSRLVQRLRHPTRAGAAGAGVLTHLPGLVYVVALNAIASTRPLAADAVAQIALYDVIWLAIPLLSLFLAARRPGAAQAQLKRASAWGHRHQRPLVIIIFAALGVYLVTKGAVGLWG